MKQLSPVKLAVQNTQEYYRMTTFWYKEPETVNFLLNFMIDGDIFYDIGSCVGQYSLLASYLYPKSTIYAFEPHVKNFKRIIDNIEINKSPNIVPVYLALADKPGLETFCINQKDIGTTGSQLYHLEGASYSYKIQVLTIDQISSVFDFPNIIKLDVDGIEYSILKGAEQTLKDPRLKGVILEVNQEKEEIFKLMTDCGFTYDNLYTSYSMMQKAFMYKSPDGKVQLIPKQSNIIFTRVS